MQGGQLGERKSAYIRRPAEQQTQSRSRSERVKSDSAVRYARDAVRTECTVTVQEGKQVLPRLS